MGLMDNIWGGLSEALLGSSYFLKPLGGNMKNHIDMERQERERELIQLRLEVERQRTGLAQQLQGIGNSTGTPLQSPFTQQGLGQAQPQHKHRPDEYEDLEPSKKKHANAIEKSIDDEVKRIKNL